MLCDRHFGGINYPVGGVGGIAKSLVKGLVDQGSDILYKANVTNIILENGNAVSLILDKRNATFLAWAIVYRIGILLFSSALIEFGRSG